MALCVYFEDNAQHRRLQTTPGNDGGTWAQGVEFIAHVQLVDWTASYNQPIIVDGYDDFGPPTTRAEFFIEASTGKLVLNKRVSDGDSEFVSTVAPTINNGEALWLKAVFVWDNGSSLHEVTFYTGPDGVVWTQLGSSVTTTMKGNSELNNNPDDTIWWGSTGRDVDYTFDLVTAEDNIIGNMFYGELKNVSAGFSSVMDPNDTVFGDVNGWVSAGANEGTVDNSANCPVVYSGDTTVTVGTTGRDYTSFNTAMVDAGVHNGFYKMVLYDSLASFQQISSVAGTPTIDNYVWLDVDPSARHDGTPSTGALVSGMECLTDYTRIEHLRIEPTGIGNYALRIFDTTNVLVSRCIFDSKKSSNTEIDFFFTANYTDSTCSLFVDNCVFYDGEYHMLLVDCSAAPIGSTTSLYVDHCSFTNLDGHGKNWTGGLRTQVDASVGAGTLDTYVYNCCFGNNFHDYTAGGGGTQSTGSPTITDNGSHNAWNSDTTYILNNSGNFGLNEQDISSGGLTTITTTAQAWIVTDLLLYNYTPVLATGAGSNLILKNGTNRIGLEPDPRQDFSTDISGSVRPSQTGYIDIGPLQLTSAPPAAPSDMTQIGADLTGDNTSSLAGFSVDLDSAGDRMASLFPGDDLVRFYDRSGFTWTTPVSDLTITGAVSLNQIKLSGDGTRVFVADSSYNVGAGRVQAYDWNGSSWSQAGSDMSGTGGQFGFSIDCSDNGTYVVVGAPGNGVEDVYVFEWTGSAWSQRGTTISDNVDSDSKEGEYVAMNADGSVIVVGAPKDDVDGLFTDPSAAPGAARAYAWSGVDYVQRGTTFKYHQGFSSKLGEAVAINDAGDRVFIMDAGPLNGHHRVTAFDWNGSTWVKVGENIPDPIFSSRHSTYHQLACSGDGNRLVWGNDRGSNSFNALDRGSVYVWDYRGVDWIPYEPHFLQGIDLDDNLGTSVAVSKNGQIVAYGASQEGGITADGQKGWAAAWYLEDNVLWELTSTRIEIGGANTESGWDIDMSDDGSRLILGAPEDSAGSGSGTARIYSFSGGSWSQDSGSPIDDGYNLSARFGESVAMSGDGLTAAIGTSLMPNGGASLVGLVQVYEWTGSTWAQKGVDLRGPNLADNGFGWSVSLSNDGDLLAVGNYIHNGSIVPGTSTHQVVVYEWGGSSWAQKGSAVTISSQSNDGIPVEVEISDDGTRFIAGMQLENNGGTERGIAKVYEWSVTQWNQVGTTIGGTDNDNLGKSVDLNSDGSRIVIGVPGANSDTGAVRIYDWNGSAWVQFGSDITGLGGVGDRFGSDVAISTLGNRLFLSSEQRGPSENGAYALVYKIQGGAFSRVGQIIGDYHRNYDFLGGPNRTNPTDLTLSRALAMSGNGKYGAVSSLDTTPDRHFEGLLPEGTVLQYSLQEPSGFLYWDGSNWINSALYRWDGSSWVTAPVYNWNGSSWVN